MIPKNQLHELNAAEFDLSDKASLVDIKTLSVDTDLKKPDRMTQYIKAVHNPYLFRVGETAVRVRYGKGNHTLQKSVANVLMLIRD